MTDSDLPKYSPDGLISNLELDTIRAMIQPDTTEFIEKTETLHRALIKNGVPFEHKQKIISFMLSKLQTNLEQIPAGGVSRQSRQSVISGKSEANVPLNPAFAFPATPGKRKKRGKTDVSEVEAQAVLISDTASDLSEESLETGLVLAPPGLDSETDLHVEAVDVEARQAALREATAEAVPVPESTPVYPESPLSPEPESGTSQSVSAADLPPPVLPLPGDERLNVSEESSAVKRIQAIIRQKRDAHLPDDHLNEISQSPPEVAALSEAAAFIRQEPISLAETLFDPEFKVRVVPVEEQEIPKATSQTSPPIVPVVPADAPLEKPPKSMVLNPLPAGAPPGTSSAEVAPKSLTHPPEMEPVFSRQVQIGAQSESASQSEAQNELPQKSVTQKLPPQLSAQARTVPQKSPIPHRDVLSIPIKEPGFISAVKPSGPETAPIRVTKTGETTFSVAMQQSVGPAIPVMRSEVKRQEAEPARIRVTKSTDPARSTTSAPSSGPKIPVISQSKPIPAAQRSEAISEFSIPVVKSESSRKAKSPAQSSEAVRAAIPVVKNGHRPNAAASTDSFRIPSSVTIQKTAPGPEPETDPSSVKIPVQVRASEPAAIPQGPQKPAQVMRTVSLGEPQKAQSDLIPPTPPVAVSTSNTEALPPSVNLNTRLKPEPTSPTAAPSVVPEIESKPAAPGLKPDAVVPGQSSPVRKPEPPKPSLDKLPEVTVLREAEEPVFMGGSGASVPILDPESNSTISATADSLPIQAAPSPDKQVKKVQSGSAMDALESENSDNEPEFVPGPRPRSEAELKEQAKAKYYEEREQRIKDYIKNQQGGSINAAL